MPKQTGILQRLNEGFEQGTPFKLAPKRNYLQPIGEVDMTAKGTVDMLNTQAGAANPAPQNINALYNAYLNRGIFTDLLGPKEINVPQEITIAPQRIRVNPITNRVYIQSEPVSTELVGKQQEPGMGVRNQDVTQVTTGDLSPRTEAGGSQHVGFTRVLDRSGGVNKSAESSNKHSPGHL